MFAQHNFNWMDIGATVYVNGAADYYTIYILNILLLHIVLFIGSGYKMRLEIIHKWKIARNKILTNLVNMANDEL